MKQLRKIYRRDGYKEKERQYLFTSKKMRRMEDLFRLRDKDMEALETQVKEKRSYSRE